MALNTKSFDTYFWQYARSTPKASLTTSQVNKVEESDSFQKAFIIKNSKTFFWL